MFQSCQQKVESIIHLRKEMQLQSPSQMDSHSVTDSQALPFIGYVSWLKYHTLHGIPLQQKREPFTYLGTSETTGGYSYKCKNQHRTSTPWISTWFILELLTFDVMCYFPWVIFHIFYKLSEESGVFLLRYLEHLAVMRAALIFCISLLKSYVLISAEVARHNEENEHSQVRQLTSY